MIEAPFPGFSPAAGSVEHFPEAVLLVDSAGQVKVANQRARALFGAAVLGRGLQQVIAEFAVDTGCGWSEVAAAANQESLPIHSRSGAEYVAIFCPWLTGEGARAGSIASITDVTELKRLQRLRTACLGFLNHDMRSPAVSLMALLDLCELAPDQKPADFMALVRRSAERCLDAAEDFLRLVEAWEWGSTGTGTLSLTDVLQDAVDEVWPRAREAKVDIRFSGREGETAIRGHRRWLVRAMVGLLRHALKNGVTPGYITCGVNYRNARWCVWLEYLVREPNVEDPARTLEKAGPLGAMGAAPMRAEVFPLAMAKIIVDKHAGRLTAERSGNASIVFQIEFPSA